MERLIGQDGGVPQGLEVTDRGMQIDGLHRVTRDEPNAVEILRQHEEFLVVGMIAGAPPSLRIRAGGWTADCAEGHMIAADPRRIGGVAGVEIEFGRSTSDQFLY